MLTAIKLSNGIHFALDVKATDKADAFMKAFDKTENWLLRRGDRTTTIISIGYFAEPVADYVRRFSPEQIGLPNAQMDLHLEIERLKASVRQLEEKALGIF